MKSEKIPCISHADIESLIKKNRCIFKQSSSTFLVDFQCQ